MIDTNVERATCGDGAVQEELLLSELVIYQTRMAAKLPSEGFGTSNVDWGLPSLSDPLAC